MKVRIIATLIFITGIAIGFFVFDTGRFHLGLDLSGGTLLTYRADTSELGGGEIDEAMSALRDVIERRVNLFGVSEPLVQVEESSGLVGAEEQRLIVELPGVTDVDAAVRQLGQTPLLEFKLYQGDGMPPDAAAYASLPPEIQSALYASTGLTGRFLEESQIQFGQGQSLVQAPVVVLSFDNEGADLFEEITSTNIGEVLAIFLDDVPISQPVIQGAIPGGQAVITGDFQAEEARELVRNLNFGALPVPIELIGTQSVGAAFGQDVLVGAVRAALWGFVFVALFMLLWYRAPGAVAVLALALYAVVVLGLFKLIPVTLTAAGIAGFILSVGMAVDANVLIFERFKEERRSGRDLATAIREGFSRAWPSIRDGNLSTLITAAILFWFGTSIVQGFALTLGVGVLISMVTAITATRLLLLAVAAEKSRWLFRVGLDK